MSQYTKVRTKSPITLEDSLGNLYKYLKPNSKILDVGCSAGYFGEFLIKEKNAAVDGIEYNPDDARVAKKVLNNVYTFDLDSSNWPKELLKNKYDFILFGDVLEHLKNPGEVLEKFRKLLSKKGRVIISIPNIAHVSIRLEILNGSFEYEKLGIIDETHLKYFTFKSFSRLLSDAGYKVIDYDQTTIPVSKDVINKYLQSVGLKATNSFYKEMSKPEALAFQYKFIAEPGNSSKKLKLSSKPMQLSQEYQVEINKLLQDIDKLNIKENELEGLKSSKSWRYTQHLRNIRNLTINRKKR